jgi:DNA-binding transcriptional MerR regulator
MRIGEVASAAGVSVETLRYYERRGLLPEPARSMGGHRDYAPDAVRFVRAVKEAQSLGLSLAEIEECLRLTRRTPDGAVEAVRSRLRAKLDEIDERIAALRRARTGIERALNESGAALERSTTNAAYLLRGGRDPELLPGEPLHVTNGESAAGTLRTIGLGGVVLSWDDVLHEGPLADVPPRDFNAVRGRFFERQGWGSGTAIAAELDRRDELLARGVADGHPIVLWFEHDLFDQLQLLQVLAAVNGADAGQVQLVQSDRYLGSLEAEELERLWPARRPIGPGELELARSCWLDVCESRIDACLARDTTAFPYLAAALRRLQEERQTVPRTKRQLLQALLGGPLRAGELFAANQAREEAIFLGDAWCFAHLHELSIAGLVAPVGRAAMPAPPPAGEVETFARVALELTEAGRSLLATLPA